MRRFVIAGLVVAAAAAAGTAMAGGLLGGGTAAKGPRTSEKRAVPSVSCRCKRGPRGPRGRQGPQGAQGPEGPTGPQGPQGPAATGLFAVVDSDGTVFKSSGLTGVTHDGIGTYTVTFNRNVDNCAAVGDAGGHRSGSSPGALPHGIVNVTTFDTTVTVGTWTFTDIGPAAIVRSDRPFHLAVFC